MGLCPSPKPGRIFWEVRWDKRSSHLTPNQIQRLSDLQGLRGFHDGMKAGKAKPHHPEILTWGRRCARRWRGEAAPLPLEAHATFLLPTPTSQERDVASDAPEASATESPGQWKASAAARGGGKTAKNSGLKPTHLTAPGEGTKSAVAQKELRIKGKRVLQIVPLPNFLRGRVGEIQRLPSPPPGPLPPPPSASSGPKQPPETSLTLGA